MDWTWTWDADIADPDLIEAIQLGWSSREAAEDWLSSWFAELRDTGVFAATLVHNGDPVCTMDLDDG